jgi:hypothetical protein
METLYFILGILSIIVTALIVTIVWGVVKIHEQQHQINNIDNQLDYRDQWISDRVIKIENEIREANKAKQVIKG